MKKLIILVLTGFCILACNAQVCYRVSGVFNGEPNAESFLIGVEKGQRDTLARVPVVNGRFVMTGEMEKEVPLRVEIVSGRHKKMTGCIDVPTGQNEFMVYIIQGNGSNDFFVGQKAWELGRDFYLNEKLFVERKKVLFQEFLAGSEAGKDSVSQEFSQLVDRYEAKESEVVGRNPEACAAAVLATSVAYYGQRMKKYDYAMGNRVSSAELEVKGWNLLKKRYARLNDAAKDWGKRINMEVAMEAVDRNMAIQERLTGTSVGKVAPNFTVDNPGGKSFSLYSVKAKLKLIDIWGSHCGPCRAENPYLVQIYKDFHSKGFEVISISLDRKKEEWLNSIATDKLIWEYNGLSRGGSESVATLFGITGVPCTLLLDENNKIIERDLRGEQLREKIAEYLK